MFHKPVKVKSNSAIRGSERKRLRAELGQAFPEVSQECLTALIPTKDDMTVTKLQTHGGDNVLVYSIHKNPVFFEVDRVTYPTVYTLWQFPELLHCYTTWPPVLENLSNGADLMLAGVIIRADSGPLSFGNLGKGDRCAVNLANNKAPIAVGFTNLSSGDMIITGRRGKGVIILHTYGDHLWALGTKSHPPVLAKVLGGGEEVDDSDAQAEVTSSLANSDAGKYNSEASVLDNAADNINTLKLNDEINGVEKKSKQSEVSLDDDDSPAKSEVEIMDELLHKCFFTALKTTAKKVELPLLTSALFRTHMVPCLPRGVTLDIKKTSFKKLTKFLQEMQKQNIIEVKELAKGVESVTGINFAHPDVKMFKPEVNVVEDVGEEVTQTDQLQYHPPEIVEMVSVTAAVLPLFKECGLGKGAAMTPSDVRKCLMEYVKKNDLKSTTQKGLVTMDPILTDCLVNKGENVQAVRWDELTSRCCNKMQPAFQVTFPGQAPIVRKGKLEPIDMTVATRAGNKKVTLVINLEVYGIDPHAFAHQVQVGVAASTSVHPAPNRKEGMQVLVQGNQVEFVGRLLVDDYHLNRKYVRGLELAAKKKKK